MIQALAFLLLTSTSGVAAPTPMSCPALLLSEAPSIPLAPEANFKAVIESLRAAGARELLAPLDRGEIQTVFQSWRMPWQSMVSGRQGWRGQPTLKVRGFDYRNEKEKQEAVWKTAMALFELETRTNLWSYRGMLTPDERQKFDLSMSASDESLEYFLVTQPVEWRDLQLKRLEKLENELYAVFASLNKLKAEDYLPKNDPGRFWKLRSLLGGDASRSIAPNQADFAAWRDGAPADLKSRHGGNLLFNYYMNFLKRAMVLALAAQVIAATPQVPSYLDAMFSVRTFSQEQSASPRGYVEDLKTQVKQEEARLKKEIASQKAKAASDVARIRSLEKDLSDLYDLYPWLAHSGR